MAILTPYIPTYITVHLGAPSAQAENVTLSFHDYVKNVACSEIYPTWEENALRANILAITSFALNRVYTEFYRSRGYAFDITSSTAFDQAFVNGRNYFANVTALVDELFDDYIRRVGFVEPLAAKFCNGITVTCEGLSQWGSQYLARQGNGWLRILTWRLTGLHCWRRLRRNSGSFRNPGTNGWTSISVFPSVRPVVPTVPSPPEK